ncbi:hypothetical protein KIH74_21135 [Kineosporia sp. J2-2]|uniref:CBM6 domain-containing protein n=1 Tax=Kineosporia corallincola TaxID=2835133 RepID=A0ABS5TK31_9ACTN|nr:hypothetical protein [Kineosporia corallincola]MBT0771455.1 hypothetical protein [Kineosporia corallincola]
MTRTRTTFDASAPSLLWRGGPPRWRVAGLGAACALAALVTVLLLSPGGSSAGNAAEAGGPPPRITIPAAAADETYPPGPSTTPTPTTPKITTTPTTTVSASVRARPTATSVPASSSLVSTATPRARRTTETTTTQPAPTFSPVTVAAADASVSGGAAVVECSGCRSGSRVAYLEGTRAVTLTLSGVPVAGARQLTIVYESDNLRDLTVTVNGDSRTLTSLPGAGDWVTPATVTVGIELTKGTNTLVFANPAGPAPDLDQFVIR